MYEPNQTYGKQHTILNCYRLPGRLNVEQAAALLGFMRHDIPVLVGRKLLQPLGKPPANGIKYFAPCVLEQLKADERWLSAATETLSKYWRHKNGRDKSDPKLQSEQPVQNQ